MGMHKRSMQSFPFFLTSCSHFDLLNVGLTLAVVLFAEVIADSVIGLCLRTHVARHCNPSFGHSQLALAA